MDLSIYNNKRVFITGNTGFKGSWLQLWLNTLGAKTLGYSLPPLTQPSHFELLGGQRALETIFGDIRDSKALHTALHDFNPDIIFHLAAQPLVISSYQNPKETFEINAMGTFNLLEALRLETLKDSKDPKALVVITTDKVYENKEWVYGYRESDPLGGYDPYSSSKACAEIITHSMQMSFFAPKDFNTTHQTLIATARSGNVIGGGDWSAHRLIPDLIRSAIKGEPACVRYPHARRPWQYVLDPLRGYLMLGARLLNADKEFATSFNFAPSLTDNLPVSTMLRLAQAQWDQITYQIHPNTHLPHEANLLMLDAAKAYHLLKWQPLYTCKESIAQTISWYQSFYTDQTIDTHQNLKDYTKALGGGAKHSSRDRYNPTDRHNLRDRHNFRDKHNPLISPSQSPSSRPFYPSSIAHSHAHAYAYARSIAHAIAPLTPQSHLHPKVSHAA
ncbi:CDP-glucose 4,6-dehydratase [Helicobacter sp. 12S02634-8]|uniref:CDP-glucose 4,6-dehydratase n=1 Tax=Helicobacter sp. 12S02634-8 TaxID=1476199 RepID=UPI000BA5CC37|nr:CDP-glucose 4,6-dehydratase [Helicobacter sp. 12S02634-8]PAF47040.1 CDP-glucose 4,6-dehydratase [Helicobacter sp. 12S02634-8]